MRASRWFGVLLLVTGIFVFNYIRLTTVSPGSVISAKYVLWKRRGIFPWNEYSIKDESQKSNHSVTSANVELITETTKQDMCKPLALVGPLKIDLKESEDEYWNQTHFNATGNGSDTRYLGDFASRNSSQHDHEAVFFDPSDCRAEQSIAIIIPFRDRESHLRILLGHLLRILRRQNNRFSIFVIEQLGNGTFNKGRLMNSGFTYALEAGEKSGFQFDCYIFQDVDLLMENDKLLYKCGGGNKVDHLSTSISKFNYRRLCCGMTIGGVVGFSKEQFQKVNGFPNNFWGWGGEDDAMHQRLRLKKLAVQRPVASLGRYTMIKHDRDALNPKIKSMGQALSISKSSIDTNGLKDLNTTVSRVEKYQHFVKIMIDVGNVES